MRRPPAGWPHAAVVPALALVLTGAGGGAANAAGAAQQVQRCHARLVVKFSPEVPNPRSLEFLSSFVGDPGFRLVWRGHSDMSQTLELIGPGPQYRCTREIDRMRNDARIINLRVIH